MNRCDFDVLSLARSFFLSPSHSRPLLATVEMEHLLIVSSCDDSMLSSSLPNIRMYQWRMRLNLNLHECGTHEMASAQATQGNTRHQKQVTTNFAAVKNESRDACDRTDDSRCRINIGMNFEIQANPVRMAFNVFSSASSFVSFRYLYSFGANLRKWHTPQKQHHK